MHIVEELKFKIYLHTAWIYIKKNWNNTSTGLCGRIHADFILRKAAHFVIL